MSPSILQAAVTTILNSPAGPEISEDDLVHAVVEMVANRGVWGVPARGIRVATGQPLQTIPISDEVAQIVARTVNGPTISVRDAKGTAHIPDLASVKPLSAEFREALSSITQGKRKVVARYPVFAGARDRVVIVPRASETGDRHSYLPESREALVARVLTMIESSEAYRGDLRQCQLSEVLRECGKPSDWVDEHGCSQFYFMSLRRQQGKTVTGSVRVTKTGGRDPGSYCCAAHTLAARRVRETRRKLDQRAEDKASTTIKKAGKVPKHK